MTHEHNMSVGDGLRMRIGIPKRIASMYYHVCLQLCLFKGSVSGTKLPVMSVEPRLLGIN